MGTSKREKRRWVSRLRLLSLFTAIVFVLVGAGFFSFYFLGGTKSFKGIPVYEEIYRTGEPLKSSIRKVDQALFEVFFANNVPDQDINFVAVGPREKGGEVWEFTDLIVRCPDQAFCAKVRKDIVDYLRERCPECLKICQKNKERIVCKIWINGFLTHRVSLLVNKEKSPASTRRPKVALIIDDLGYDMNMVRRFFESGIPLSFSVLPYAPYSKEVATVAREKGYEVLLHLPMEPKSYPKISPGPGVILLSMSEDQIRETIEKDIAQVPGVCGVNNHMGSSFTEHADKMSIVLRDLSQKGLFYVDSRTSSSSLGYALATKLGIPCAERDIFIDNDLNKKSIKMQIQRLLKISQRTGEAIGIAHPHKETIEVIMELIPTLNSQVELVPVSRLVKNRRKKMDIVSDRRRKS